MEQNLFYEWGENCLKLFGCGGAIQAGKEGGDLENLTIDNVVCRAAPGFSQVFFTGLQP